jgi:hypothetical protein
MSRATPLLPPTCLHAVDSDNFYMELWMWKMHVSTIKSILNYPNWCSDAVVTRFAFARVDPESNAGRNTYKILWVPQGQRWDISQPTAVVTRSTYRWSSCWHSHNEVLTPLRELSRDRTSTRSVKIVHIVYSVWRRWYQDQNKRTVRTPRHKYTFTFQY